MYVYAYGCMHVSCAPVRVCVYYDSEKGKTVIPRPTDRQTGTAGERVHTQTRRRRSRAASLRQTATVPSRRAAGCLFLPRRPSNPGKGLAGLIFQPAFVSMSARPPLPGRHAVSGDGREGRKGRKGDRGDRGRVWLGWVLVGWVGLIWVELDCDS